MFLDHYRQGCELIIDVFLFQIKDFKKKEIFMGNIFLPNRTDKSSEHKGVIMTDKKIEVQEADKLHSVKKKCCQTNPEIKICGCRSKKEKNKILTFLSRLFKI